MRYVDNGRTLTSAGAAAGLDLCLHPIRLDHGTAVAADAARLSVRPLEREGGQAQCLRETTADPVDRIPPGRSASRRPPRSATGSSGSPGVSPRAYRGAFRQERP